MCVKERITEQMRLKRVMLQPYMGMRHSEICMQLTNLCLFNSRSNSEKIVSMDVISSRGVSCCLHCLHTTAVNSISGPH